MFTTSVSCSAEHPSHACYIIINKFIKQAKYNINLLFNQFLSIFIQFLGYFASFAQKAFSIWRIPSSSIATISKRTFTPLKCFCVVYDFAAVTYLATLYGVTASSGVPNSLPYLVFTSTKTIVLSAFFKGLISAIRARIFQNGIWRFA